MNPEEFSFVAMGCAWKVKYFLQNSSFKSKDLKIVILKKVSQYDETFSNWSPDSELSQLLKKGLAGELTASPLFVDALKLAKDFYKESKGIFDISLGQTDLNKLLFKAAFFNLREALQKL